MKKILQINVTANWGSTGKIAEDIGRLAISHGWESWVAYGRGNPVSDSHLIRIGNDLDMKLHGLQTRLFDRHGLASKNATKNFIKELDRIQPDLIHLHNIHGYYLNYPILFDFLKSYGAPIVWTLHDCWPFTGHCAYYDYLKCNKWKSHCHDCPDLSSYPSSRWFDNSRNNFNHKKKAFLGCKNLTFVPVSDWLDSQLSQSFLKEYPSKVIKNGIDISVFSPYGTAEKIEEPYVIGIASIWERRKGLGEYVKLRKLLPEEIGIILVGLTTKQIEKLPKGIKGITRTENVQELVELYSNAKALVNASLEDNFPTVNLESLACGTPVITYDTGGSPEAIDSKTGIVARYGDVEDLAVKVKDLCLNETISREDCRRRAELLFDKNITFKKYIELYESLIK